MIDFVVRKKFQDKIEKEHFKEIVESVFKHLEIDPIPGISILFTDNKEIKALNQQYRGFDEPTDVLSFNNEYIDPATGEKYLGDIAISYPTALSQAEKDDLSVIHELELLIVHGCLHLSGFDHADDKSKEQMWKLQSEILQKINNPLDPID